MRRSRVPVLPSSLPLSLRLTPARLAGFATLAALVTLSPLTLPSSPPAVGVAWAAPAPAPTASFSGAAGAASAAGAGAAAFTVEQVMAAPFASQLVAARQGERVAWVLDRQGERNVWVADGPAFVPRQVTHYQGDEGQPIASLRLTPDGWTVLYARGSEVNEGGESANPTSRVKAPKQQVWAIDVDAGAAGKVEPRLLGDMGCPEEGCEDIQVSPDGRSAVWAARHHLWLAPVAGGAPARSLHDLQGDSSQQRWSPDGKRLAFRLDRRDHSFIAIYDLAGESARYLSPSADRDELPRWSPDGAHVAFLREPAAGEKLPLIPLRPRPWSLWVGDPASGAAHEVWHSSSDLDGSLPLFADSSLFYAAGGRIVFASEQNEGGRNHLYSVAETGGGAPLLLTPGDYDVEDVALGAAGDSVLFSANEHAADPGDEDRRHLWRVGAAGGGAPRALSGGGGIEWAPVVTGDARAVLCFASTATTPGVLSRVRTPAGAAAAGAAAGAPGTAAGAPEPLARDLVPAAFPAAALVAPRQVIWKSGDGTTLHGQLFVPRGAPRDGRSLPALIFTHGGPVRQMLLGFHYMQYYHNAYAMNQYLAARGFVVLSVNYRLGIMYGRAFREAPHGGWRGAAEYGDVVAGARYLQGLPEVDPHRIGLWGGSYGGLLTALGLARNSDLFAAGVDFHGVHDWSLFLPRWEGSPAAAPDAKEAYQLAFESSPAAAAGTWRSPVLLIHGDDDRNVPFGQTRDLVYRLRSHQVPFEELIFPDEIHDLLLWQDWVRAYQAAADFLARHLQPRDAAPAAR
jgi:dipeptidyl aminopeptidase/acylaminoacyl peptidase